MMRVLVPVIFAVGAACGASNTAGNTAATTPGDMSHPAQRGSPIEALRAACGTGDRTDVGKTRIKRQPYLQQVTATSAMVGWVTTAPTGEHLDLSMPDGSPVMQAMATSENGLVRESGEKQMWGTITGLQPDTVYCYQLANGEPLTERTGFRTAPAMASTNPIRILAFGDSGGGGNDQADLRDQMLDYPADLIIHTGDLAYDDGTIGQFEDTVFGVYTDLFKNLPFFPAAGNHEYHTLQGAPFRTVFALPGASGEKWYSYDYGRIHFAVLDTEADYTTQAKWLDNDLAASDAPWKIVYMHRPPYSTGEHGSDTSLRRVLAPVVEKHHVQLVLAGHDHDYERMIPQNGVGYVVTGGGGRGTYKVGKADFTAYSQEVIHFVSLDVGTDQLVLHAIDATGAEFDSMVVPRTP